MTFSWNNAEVDDFNAAVDAVNKGELTTADLLVAYTDAYGYWPDHSIAQLSYFASFVQDLLAKARERRRFI